MEKQPASVAPNNKFRSEQTALFPVDSAVPEGSNPDPLLYLLRMADLPTDNSKTIAIHADYTTILSSHLIYTTALYNLQNHLVKNCKTG